MAALFTAALAHRRLRTQPELFGVSQADIQRLQDNVYRRHGMQQLRVATPLAHAAAQSQLDDLRDEVIYLKVKLRKDGTVGRSEYSTVRTVSKTCGRRARGETNNTASTSTGTALGRSSPGQHQHAVLVDRALRDVDEPDRRARRRG